jgi:hypothetical protein
MIPQRNFCSQLSPLPFRTASRQDLLLLESDTDLLTWQPDDKLHVTVPLRRSPATTAADRAPRRLAAPLPGAGLVVKVAPASPAFVGPNGLTQLLSNLGALHQQQATAKAAEDALLETRATEFREKKAAATGKVGKKRKSTGNDTAAVATEDGPKGKKAVVTGDCPEDPSGKVAATKVAAAKVAAAKVAATRRPKAAPKTAPRTASKRMRGQRISGAKKINTESDANPTSEEEAHTDTPTGTVPAPGDTADTSLGSSAAGLASSSSGAAADLAGSSSGAAASSSGYGPLVSTLSGASEDEVSGSRGISRPTFLDNIYRCRFAPTGFHPSQEYFY